MIIEDANGELRASVPVYLSRFTPRELLPEDYGAFIAWEIGERVTIVSKHGRPSVGATILTETRSHGSAPVIDGARGRGPWVREVRFDGEVGPCAISEGQIRFCDPDIRDPVRESAPLAQPEPPLPWETGT